MPFKSPYSSIQPPKIDVASLIWGASDKEDKNRVVLVNEDGTEKYSAAALKEMAFCFGNGLKNNFGFKKGQVVVLFCTSTIHIIPVIMGILQVGGVVSPADPKWSAKLLSHQLEDSAGTIIVTQHSLFTVAVSAAQKNGFDLQRIVMLPDPSEPDFMNGGTDTYFDLVANSTNKGPNCRIDPLIDISFLVYTAGVTGLPKGVELSHHNIVANVFMWSAAFSISRSDVVLAGLYIPNIYFLTVMVLHSLYNLARVVVAPCSNSERFQKVIQIHQVSVGYLIAPDVAMLSRLRISRLGSLSPIKFIVYTGSPLSGKLTQSFYDYHGIKLLQAYGISEASPAVSVQSLAQYPIANGSVGWLLPNQEAKLLDQVNPDVEITERNQPGELCIRGPNIFKSYHGNPGATEASFTNDGFFKTGDMAMLDSGGYLCIAGRVVQPINFKGLLIAPKELEDVILEHKGVWEVCVVPVYDKVLKTDVPQAHIVLTRGWQPTVQHGLSFEQEAALELEKWVEKRVDEYKRLRGGVHIVPKLPKTTGSKLIREAVRRTRNKSML
ncbi:phenylacetyl-CoA ligase [Xylaria venustula]|nr:phenylacetyl-CoA ligase [Xylaria venustula]